MNTDHVLSGEFRPIDENIEIFSLIWLDGEVNDARNHATQKQVRSLINHFKKFDNKEACQRYIEQRYKDDRLVIIVSGGLGRELVPDIHTLRQVSSIYVYCMNKKINEEWACKHSKIKGVIIETDELISAIDTNQKYQMKIEQPFTITIFTKNTNGDVAKIKANSQFIYFQLLLDCFRQMKSYENDKNELISLLEKEYKGNDDQLDINDEFKTDYSPEKVLWWYTRQSFFGKILNKALDVQNIYMMYLFHTFISHIYVQLKQNQSNSPLQVFRSQILSTDELNNLKENRGQLISINLFLSAYTDRSKALEDFSQFKRSVDLERVLFEINADPALINRKPFGLISSKSEFVDKSEVLFMAGSIFSINEIICDDNRLWIIKMTLCSDEEYYSILNSVQIKKQNENDQSDLRTLAKILWKMEKLDLAENYYNRLIKQLSPNDPLLTIVYDDLGRISFEKEKFDDSVNWLRKSIENTKHNSPLIDIDGLNTFIDYFPEIECTTPRPVCHKQNACDQLNDEAHASVFFHRLLCKYGGRCKHIDDKKHSKAYKHPDFCTENGFCHDMNELHLSQYRHVPLCDDGIQCSLLITRDKTHCTAYRHCKVSCELQSYCNRFHNNEHIEDENHPFVRPCPFTPYMCHLHDKSKIEDSNSSNAAIHCFRYSHVCPVGRQCPRMLDKEHIQSNIHIIRIECPDKENCSLLNNENHLNSYCHPSINDIRRLCQHPRSDCPDRSNIEHIKQFRHSSHFDHHGVCRYLALNKNINFINNQNEMIQNIVNYLSTAKWNEKTINISDELKRWILALQPIHRCNPLIFESILVHGHVMSREHMNSLRESVSVAKSIKQHMKVKHIFQKIKNERLQRTCEGYIKMLVDIEFKQVNDEKTIKSDLKQCELVLKDFVTKEDIETLQKWTTEIAQASLQLNSSPTGIKFAADQNFETDKHVFSILGPHTGYYYGDIIIVFRSELMYHPDSNFSIQAATTFGTSGNAYRWRPWLKDPGSPATRIEHFHKTKLHCSIPGYENAAAYELMALAGLTAKSTANIDLNTIQQRWLTIDSHCALEAHLPQLIPLDYVDRVYIAQSTFDSLTPSSQQSAKTIFGNALRITPHQIDMNIGPAGLHKPLDPTRIPYQSYVIKDICEMIENRSNSLLPLEGTIITLPSSGFKEHIIVPMTISQSHNQYKSNQDPLKDLSNIIYIYWEAFNGDMMLTLTNKMIDNIIEQNDLQFLTCYIAKWPSNNMNQNVLQPITDYREDFSYIGNHSPIKHYFIVDDQKFKSSSNSFHRGCNTNEYITYNLTINRNTCEVKLSIVGSNQLYNNHSISYTFEQTEFNLNTLEYIHISAGSQTVPIRNLIIRHESIDRLHPSIDIDYINNNISSLKSTDRSISLENDEPANEPYFSLPTRSPREECLKPCVNSINCLLLYQKTEEANKHLSEFSHPCRFSELCLNKSIEPHLVHIPHKVPKCQYNDKCPQLIDPLHRAQFRHSKLPDYLIPCRFQKECRTKTADHRVKYSHGEAIPLPSFTDT